MIVDTGASTVVLRPEDARKAGIQVSALDYTVPVETANGRAFAARVKLDRVSLGESDFGKGRSACHAAGRASTKPARYEFFKPFAVL